MKTITLIICLTLSVTAFSQARQDSIITAINPEFIESVAVYPNPYRESVVITHPHTIKVSTIDLNGIKVDLNNVPSGVYFVVFYDEKNRYPVRVIKN